MNTQQYSLLAGAAEGTHAMDHTPEEAAVTVAGLYGTRVAEDLARNEDEQKRVVQQMTALQQRLESLRADHRLLTNVRAALDAGTAPAGVHRGGANGTGHGRGASPGELPGRPRRRRRPPLHAVVADVLAGQDGPRTAAEITAAVMAAHPERQTKNTLVRNALETLVSRSQAERMRRRRFVFYTALG